MHEQVFRPSLSRPSHPEPRPNPRMPVRRPVAPRVEASSVTVQRQCAACTEDEELKRKTEPGGGEHDTAPAIVGDVVGSGGQPLSAEERAYFEPRLGRPLDDVRIHTDARADASARAVNAIAYTVGHDIAFRQGAFAPATASGRRLLAHELAHVAQGSPGASARAGEGGLRVSDPDDASEREADRIADTVVRGDGRSPSREAGPARESAGVPTVEASASTLHREPAVELPAEPIEPVPESGVRPKVPTPTGSAPQSGPGFWGRVGRGLGAVGGLVTGPLLVGLAAIAAILTYSSKTAPRWRTEINPITGEGYASPEEFEEISRLPPEEIERRKKEHEAATSAGTGKPPAPAGGPAPAPQPSAAPQEQAKETCAEKMPNLIRCDDPKLNAHTFRSENGAFKSIKLPDLRKEQQGATATSGPCVGRGGWHTRVKSGGTYVASIVCCPCCDDSSGKAIGGTRCMVHWH